VAEITIPDEEVEVAAAELLNRYKFDWYKTESMARVVATHAARELLIKDRELADLRKNYTQQLKDQKAHYEEAVAIALRGEVKVAPPPVPVDGPTETVKEIAASIAEGA
jgi:hypothetical protein